MSGATERRIPSLDGARAIAVALVFTWHLLIYADLPLIWRVDYGNLGVRIFFVISGFIITALLLAERERTGKISIVDFYVRRAFRIFPAYYVFLAVMALMLPTGWLILHKVDFLPSAAFFADYQTPHDALGHTWSLAVEEQFYLLWPGVIVLLGLRRAVYACIALLLITPAFRMLVDLSVWPDKPMRGFECVADALACGCILAVARERLWNNALYRRLVSSPYLGLIPLAVLLFMAVAMVRSRVLYDTVGIPLLNFGVAMMLDRYMRFPATATGRWLNWAPIAWMGTISYSLYLWQEPMSCLTVHLPAIVCILGAFALATASRYFIEIPFLSLRKKFSLKSSQTAPPTPQSLPAQP
jgi:peptidoglycan/LPS O-acetylase OafA/YrhL